MTADNSDHEALVGRTVWIVETGCYENRGLAGVYATAEAAMAAFPPKPVPADHVPTAVDASRPGGWKRTGHDRWSNGLDWDAAAECYPVVIQGDKHRYPPP